MYVIISGFSLECGKILQILRYNSWLVIISPQGFYLILSVLQTIIKKKKLHLNFSHKTNQNYFNVPFRTFYVTQTHKNNVVTQN